MPPVVQFVCALVGVIALIFLFFWVLRKVNKGILTTGGKRLKVLDRATLGGEKSVVVVSVAGKFCRFLFEMALDGLVKILHEMSFVENNQRIIPSF